MNKRLLGRILFCLLAILVLASFGAAFLHHHDDGQQVHDCAVCFFAKTVFTPFALFSILTLFFFSKLFIRLTSSFSSLLLASQLQTRAPPQA